MIDHLRQYPMAEPRKFMFRVRDASGKEIDHGAIRKARAAIAKAKGEA